MNNVAARATMTISGGIRRNFPYAAKVCKPPIVLKNPKIGVLGKCAKSHSGPDLEFSAYVVALALPPMAKTLKLPSPRVRFREARPRP